MHATETLYFQMIFSKNDNIILSIYVVERMSFNFIADDTDIRNMQNVQFKYI